MKHWNFSGLQKSLKVSAAILVVANVIPAIGVLLWNWSIFNIIFLYWAENLIIGFFNIIRMIIVRPPDAQSSGNGILLEKIFTIPFFTVHYGIFCLVHGVFIMFLFGEGGKHQLTGFTTKTMMNGSLKIALLALFISHLVSFFTNYVGQGEYKKTNLGILMFTPYGRIIVLHLTILLGAFIAGIFDHPIFPLIILITIKTIVDLGFHVQKHLNGNPPNQIAAEPQQ